MINSSDPNDMPLLVTAAVIIEDSRVLITRRPEHKPQGGFWEFPGGKLDPGESPTIALQRELKEELDVNISVGRVLDALYYRYSWGPVLILAYHCRITDGTISNVEVDEHLWARLDELHLYELLPADRPLIPQLQRLA